MIGVLLIIEGLIAGARRGREQLGPPGLLHLEGSSGGGLYSLR